MNLKVEKINKKLNFRLSGKIIIPTTHTRYLGIIADQHFSWNQHLKILKKKLSRANGLLAKARQYLLPNLLRTLYFAIFESQLRYGYQMWGQQISQRIADINDLHQKAIKMINFKGKSIMTFSDILRSENCLLVLKQINQALPTNLQNMFKVSENQHTHNTKTANNRQLSFPQVNRTNNGLHSVTHKAAKDWNSVQNKINFSFTEDHLLQNKLLKVFRENIFP